MTPLIYHVGFQGFALYSLPVATMSHPVGLANFLCSIIAIYLAVTIINDDRRTGYAELMMTKAISVWQYMAGRALGAFYMMAIIWCIICLTLLGSAWSLGQGPTMELVFSLLMGFVGQMALFSFAFFLSQIISPLIAGILALVLNDNVFFSMTKNIDSFQGAQVLKTTGQWLLKFFYFLVPQLSEFSLWGTPDYIYLIDYPRAAMAVLYAFVYILLMFSAAVIVFERSKWTGRE